MHGVVDGRHRRADGDLLSRHGETVGPIGVVGHCNRSCGDAEAATGIAFWECCAYGDSPAYLGIIAVVAAGNAADGVDVLVSVPLLTNIALLFHDP